MRYTVNTRASMKWQGYLTALLIVVITGLLAYGSTRHEWVFDWTAARRHTLSPASRQVLEQLTQPVVVSAYVSDANPLREQARYLVERYQRVRPDVTLEFIHPDQSPDRVRAAGIRFDGEMIVHYGERQQRVESVDEQSLTNALQSLVRGSERWVVFVQGHGERDPSGQRNHDVGQFAQQLAQRGFRTQTLVLGQTAAVPDNTALLVIASPEADWLPGEIDLVQQYLQRGGNLLLLVEPGKSHGLDPLIKSMGADVVPGTVVDPTTLKLGLDNAAMTLVARYPPHPATDGFAVLTLFPYAAGLTTASTGDWSATPLLQTADGAWSEGAAMDGDVMFDATTDVAGPLTLGVALTRARQGASPASQQRVVIIGDGDFLSNSYLGNSGNLDLGLRLFNWLSGDDTLVAIPARTAPDATLNLSKAATLIIGLGFLVALPLALIATGASIWLKRRRQ
jgi:ABC-type uncharacterized transport system involved in gliding motility auxiliary subunit